MGYYELLGVPVTATHPEIRSAYKKMILQAHPDKARTDATVQKAVTMWFRKLTEAHDVLSKETLRKYYDDCCGVPQKGTQGQNNAGENAYEIAMREIVDMLDWKVKVSRGEGKPYIVNTVREHVQWDSTRVTGFMKTDNCPCRACKR